MLIASNWHASNNECCHQQHSLLLVAPRARKTHSLGHAAFHVKEGGPCREMFLRGYRVSHYSGRLDGEYELSSHTSAHNPERRIGHILQLQV